mmetsp:Transcript_60766/g.177539  ORF Transcript_60766/g.177539 Transcript_60766/m.177539 type:complete len:212 (+) Transcript_60766:1841-2476(+)
MAFLIASLGRSRSAKATAAWEPESRLLMRVLQGRPTAAGEHHSRNTCNLHSKVAVLTSTLHTIHNLTPTEIARAAWIGGAVSFLNPRGVISMACPMSPKGRDGWWRISSSLATVAEGSSHLTCATSAKTSTGTSSGAASCLVPERAWRIRQAMRVLVRTQARKMTTPHAWSMFVMVSMPRPGSRSLPTRHQKAALMPTPKIMARLLRATRS